MNTVLVNLKVVTAGCHPGFVLGVFAIPVAMLGLTQLAFALLGGFPYRKFRTAERPGRTR